MSLLFPSYASLTVSEKLKINGVLIEFRVKSPKARLAFRISLKYFNSYGQDS